MQCYLSETLVLAGTAFSVPFVLPCGCYSFSSWGIFPDLQFFFFLLYYHNYLKAPNISRIIYRTPLHIPE